MVHLVSLCLALERGHDPRSTTALMRQLIQRLKGQFAWLDPPASRGALTVLEVVGARDLTDHIVRVERWAQAAWEAWASHHATVRAWAGRLDQPRSLTGRTTR